MYSVTIKVRWEYSHLLMDVKGTKFFDLNSCGSQHGHRGVAEITFASEKLNEWGFVIDFKEAKSFVKGWINDNWDHAVICHSADKALIEFLNKRNNRLFTLPENYNTCAECLAEYLYKTIKHNFSNKIKSVKMWETEDNYATYEE